jgi:hypothetical protein
MTQMLLHRVDMQSMSSPRWVRRQQRTHLRHWIVCHRSNESVEVVNNHVHRRCLVDCLPNVGQLPRIAVTLSNLTADKSSLSLIPSDAQVAISATVSPSSVVLTLSILLMDRPDIHDCIEFEA